MTAQLALQGQNADHDRDIHALLRIHVSEPLSRQIEKLDLLVAELGGVAQDASCEHAYARTNSPLARADLRSVSVLYREPVQC